jgi:MerR family transcriptional regulator, light-induced transcriptional regulator
MTVADEHYFSEATQQIMASLVPHPPARSTPALRCVVLPVSGESHLIGARMVSDLLTTSGIDVRFLGARLSIGHVRESLLAAPPDLVALSVTLPELVNAAADTIRALREKRALARVKIMVGGQAFEGHQTLWKRIGADALAADAAEAVGTAGRLLAGRD